MDMSSQRDSPHKIVILNPKGGSGKTTLATNLASYFANHGPPPTLVDCDPRGYSMRWLAKRASGRSKIYGIEAENFCTQTDQRISLRAWPGSHHLIVDLPAALAPDQLYDQTYDANSILIPVVPSEIDIYAAARCIRLGVERTRIHRAGGLSRHSLILNGRAPGRYYGHELATRQSSQDCHPESQGWQR